MRERETERGRGRNHKSDRSEFYYLFTSNVGYFHSELYLQYVQMTCHLLSVLVEYGLNEVESPLNPPDDSISILFDAEINNIRQSQEAFTNYKYIRIQ